jgi:antagonist of KipI
MSFVVQRAGMQTTVQDRGRIDHQHIGVPVGGAMDAMAHRNANMLVGNTDDHATLECTLAGTAVQFNSPALIALAGRDVAASVDGRAVPAWHAFRIHAGGLLSIHAGCRTSIAVAGGINVPHVLGSRSTCLRAGFGGWHGRALRIDDVLPIGASTAIGARMLQYLEARERASGDWSTALTLHPAYSAAPTVRIIAGPEHSALTDESRTTLWNEAFRIAPESDRMGFRLTGHTLELEQPREMLSSGVTAGTIQLPPGGAPIVLMADRQTTGGYPRLGDVIAVDLPLLAQLRPGDHVRFAPIALDVAQELYRARETNLAQAQRSLHLRFSPGTDGSR